METIALNIAKADYSRSLISNAKFLMKFESSPFREELSDQLLQSSGEQYSFPEKSVYGNGLRMRPKASLFLPLLLSKTDEFSFGFWLRPFWISPTVNPLTNTSVYYRMSLFDKSNFSYSSSTGFVTATDGTFAFYEECREDGLNVLKIYLRSSDGTDVVVETEAYLSGKFHHFWISYYGPSRKLNVFIDGKAVRLFSEDGLSIPENLNDNSSVYFHINNSAIGYSSLLRNNAGLLDEVVFSGKYTVDGKTIAKIINVGAEAIVEQSLFYQGIVSNCFAFDDPTSLGVTSVLSNGKNFYAGRNDGVLFKGDRTMWQVRRDFASQDEIKFVKKNIFDADSIVSVENGALKLFKASVRI